MSLALKLCNTQTIASWTQERVMFVCVHPCTQTRVRGKIESVYVCSYVWVCACVQEE